MRNKFVFIMSLLLSVLVCNVHAQNPRIMDPKATANQTINIAAKGVPSEDAAMISGAYSVAASGTIKMPYLSSALHVAGKSGRQIEEMLEAAYKNQQIYQHPVFVVTVTAENTGVAVPTVQVSGGVAQRRNVEYKTGLTLLAAILGAGDITEFGSRKVQVTRNGRTETYDYFSTKDRNMLLQPGDQVFVGPRGPFEGRPDKLLP